MCCHWTTGTLQSPEEQLPHLAAGHQQITPQMMQTSLLALLFVGHLPTEKDYIYFGKHAFPLLETALVQYVQHVKNLSSRSSRVLLPDTTEAHILMISE